MSETVTIYTTRTCGPCRRLKRELEEAGVTYREVDVNAHPTLGARIEALTGGFRIVPTVEVGKELMVNPPLIEVLKTVVSAN